MRLEKKRIKKKRLFLGLEISGATKEKIEELIEGVRPIKSGVRWEHLDNLHLTLVYLGEVSENKQVAIEEAVYQRLKLLKPFEFNLGGLGCFPRLTRAQLVFLEIDDGRKKLIYLIESLRAALDECGYRFDRTKIVPHLTIGRARRKIKGYEREELADLLRETKVNIKSINKIKSVALFESRLTSGPGKYRMLKSFRIGEKEK